MLLIDYQVGTMQLIHNQAPDLALRNSIMLAKATLAFDMPIVITSSQEERIQGVIASSLQHVAAKAYAERIKREGIVDAWGDPQFKKAVEATGRRQLIVGAVTTDISLFFRLALEASNRFLAQHGVQSTGCRNASALLVGRRPGRACSARSASACAARGGCRVDSFMG